jgi:hypothetical protein
LSKTTLRRVKEGAYSVTIPPDEKYYAFASDGDEGLIASLYSAAGEWIENRGSNSVDLTGWSPAVCVVGDPTSLVSDGSLAGQTAEDALAVWDVDSDVTYTYAAADGKWVTGPLYLNGFLYWWEYPPTLPGGGAAFDVTLRKAATDLTNPVDVGSHEITPLPAHDSCAGLRWALKTTAAGAHFEVSGGEISDTHRVQITMAGADSSDSTGSEPVEFPSVAHPDAAGKALGPGGNQGNQSVQAIEVDTTANTESRWPTTASWAIDSTKSFGVSADRTRAVWYGQRDSGGVWAVEGLTSATSGEPLSVVEIQPDPATAELPFVLFLMV